MLGFSDRKTDFLQVLGRRDIRHQLAQSLERVGLQLRKVRIQGLQTDSTKRDYKSLYLWQPGKIQLQ